MSELNRNVPIPLYYQLKEILKEQIASGVYKPGDKLPTEDELCEQFSISRTPVRQALIELVHEDLLRRIPALGTFVTEPNSSTHISGKTTLRIVVSGARWQEPLEGAAKLWNASYPDEPVYLDFQIVTQEELRTSLMAAVGRGEAPDISILDSVWVAEFAHQHYIYPFDEVDPAWLQMNGSTLVPVALAANQYEGHLYGMPISTDVSVLWYRRDWLEKEELSPPRTWDELVVLGHHFQDQEVRERYGLGEHPLVFVGGRNGGETTTHQMLPFLWSTGGDLISGHQVVLDRPGSNRALTYLKGLIHEHGIVAPDVINYAWNQAAQVFAEEKAVFAIGGSYESFFIQRVAGWDEPTFKERVGFVPIPAGFEGQSAVLAGGMSYVVYRQSHAPKQALDLLEMTGCPEVLKPFSLRTGHIPPRVPVLKELKPEEDGFVARTIPLIEIARARPIIPAYARVSRQFQTMIEDCLSGKREVSDALSLTSERISAITGFPVAR